MIIPMTVIHRLDAVLEETKDDVLKLKVTLDAAGIVNQTDALCTAAKQSFCNYSQFKLKNLASRSTAQKLKADFIAYLDGFSPNVQEILEKFKFRNQIDTMVEADILGAVIEKFVSPEINLSPKPVLNDKGEMKIPALDNHNMRTIFEELIRRFNEENNEEAGEHFTPCYVVELMADLIFMPIVDKNKRNNSKIVLYKANNGRTSVALYARDGKIWLNQQKMAELFATSKQSISYHISNILKDGELNGIFVSGEFLTTAADGTKRSRRMRWRFENGRRTRERFRRIECETAIIEE
jgi:type I restriction enzyme M protein